MHQFAYVTDEACLEDDILSMEIIIVKVKNKLEHHLSRGQHSLVDDRLDFSFKWEVCSVW